MNLFEELKRRNVFRVGALYLVASWLILQVADVGAGVLGLPDWTLRLVTFILALGLLLALVFAWVFELTPDGIKLGKNVDHGASIAHNTAIKLNVAIIALMAIAVPLATVQILAKGGIWAALIPGPESTATAPRETADPTPPHHDSVAVLPFVNMSSDPDNEYFSDGLTEELLNLLVGVDGLRVPSRTSSFAFKGKAMDIRDIARELQVAHILEGSVRRDDGRVRVTAQLIDVTSDTHVWSQTYDRDLSDIFAIQADIAGQIVSAMQLTLARAASPFQATPTRDMQAYELYLQGLQRFQQRGAGLAEAVELLQASVQRDPGLARAWGVLAATHAVIFNYLPVDPAQSAQRAREAAQRALALDPEYSLALAVMAHLEMKPAGDTLGPVDWAVGLRMFADAVARHPEDTTLRLWYGLGLLRAGYLERAREQFVAADQRDPVSGINLHWLAVADIMTGRLDDAIARLYRAMELGREPAVGELRRLYLQMGMADRVLWPTPIEDRFGRDVWAAMAQARQDPGKTAAFFDLVAERRAQWPLPYETFGLNELGKVDAFFEAFRQEYLYEQAIVADLWYPWNGPLRQAPGFVQLVTDLGLVSLWRQQGWPDLCRPDGEGFSCD